MVSKSRRTSLGRSISRLKSSISNRLRKSTGSQKVNLNIFKKVSPDSTSKNSKNRENTNTSNKQQFGNCHKLFELLSPGFNSRFNLNNNNTTRDLENYNIFSNNANYTDDNTVAEYKTGSDFTFAGGRLQSRPNLSSNRNYNLTNNLGNSIPLDKNEIENIYQEYVAQNGDDFLDAGLKTYIDAVLDTKNFRNRCFKVLSKKINYSNRLGSSGYSNSSSDYNYGSKSSTYQNYNNWTDTSSAHVDNNSRVNNTDQESMFLTPNRMGYYLTPNRHKNYLTPSKLNNQNDDTIYNLINKYEYLNSNSSHLSRMNPNGNLNDNNMENPDHTTLDNNNTLSYNQKLKVLKRIGIANDYIAKSICSKYNSSNVNDSLNSSQQSDASSKPAARNLKDFNLFNFNSFKPGDDGPELTTEFDVFDTDDDNE